MTPYTQALIELFINTLQQTISILILNFKDYYFNQYIVFVKALHLLFHFSPSNESHARVFIGLHCVCTKSPSSVGDWVVAFTWRVETFWGAQGRMPCVIKLSWFFVDALFRRFGAYQTKRAPSSKFWFQQYSQFFCATFGFCIVWCPNCRYLLNFCQFSLAQFLRLFIIQGTYLSPSSIGLFSLMGEVYPFNAAFPAFHLF